MKQLIFVGAGGLGKEILSYVEDEIQSLTLNDAKIKGFLDDSKQNFSASQIPYPYLGTVSDYAIGKDDYFLICIGQISFRNQVIQYLKNHKAQFFSYIHHTAIISKQAKIGHGVLIAPYSLVNASAIVEDFCLLNMFNSIGHDSHLGAGSVLSPYCTLNGNVKTGQNLFMGTRSSVLRGLSIGDNVTVSAHTCVRKNINSNLFIQDTPKVGVTTSLSCAEFLQ